MLSGISPVSIILILCIVIVLFGTTKLRSLGGDVGAAIKNFKKAVRDDGKENKNVIENTSQEDTEQTK